MKHSRTHSAQTLLLTLGIVLLASCGGGGGGASSSESPAVDTPNGGNPAPADTAELRIASALGTADVSQLKTEDAATLLDKAIEEVGRQQQKQVSALRSIYGDGSAATDLSLDVGKNSIAINPRSSTLATPFIVADGGAGIAAISTYGSGRGMAYGADVLQWMAGTATQQQHAPLFARATAWLVTGSGTSALPAKIRFATAGYTAATVKAYFTRVGTSVEVLSCAIADPTNTCWSEADLLIFGGGTPANPGLTELVRRYLAAGKPVLYMHPSWVNSDGGRQVLAAMGMTMGGYPGNYFASTANVSVASGRTVTAALAKADRLSPLQASLALLKQSAPSVDLTSDPAPAMPFKSTLAELGTLQEAGIDLFSGDERLLLQRLLVLWADTQRPTITYGQVSRKSPAAFLRTMATDAFIWSRRLTGTAAVAGQGDYMPAGAQSIQPTTEWEELQITLPQRDGTTLIGRGALPGKGAQIEIIEATDVGSLNLRTSYLRSWGDPVTDTGDKYPRPLRPHSFAVPLSVNVVANFNSPNGGPLMLSYSGATPNAVVKLRIKGVTRYAHFDYVAGMSDTDVAEASKSLTAGNYGWQTTKVVGGEIQQITAYAKSTIGNLKPEYYANTLIRDGLFKSNHLANGYNDAGMSDNVTALCDAFAWTCTGSLHNAPLVQHFVGWIATCGFLCSGNPIDGYAGIGLGWGYAHEMGHNTVQRVMHITPDGVHGCVVECDNNVLASATAMRVYDSLGLEISSGHPLDHPGLYAAIVANRNTGLTGDGLVNDMRDRVWANSDQNIMRAVHFQLAFLFAKSRCGQSSPTASCAMDYFSLLTKGDRLVSKAFTPATAGNYGMGRFATNSISNHDLLYVLSSKIIGQDLRKIFWMYGIPLSDAALGSVSDLNLPMAPRSFYALAAGKHNALPTGKWMDIESTTPAWPL